MRQPLPIVRPPPPFRLLTSNALRSVMRVKLEPQGRRYDRRSVCAAGAIGRPESKLWRSAVNVRRGFVRLWIATSVGLLCLVSLSIVCERFIALDCAIPHGDTRLTTAERYGCQLIGLPGPIYFLSWMIGPPVLTLLIGTAFACVALGVRPDPG